MAQPVWPASPDLPLAGAAAAPAPCRFTPCNPGRYGASPTVPIMLTAVALNYVPLVLFNLDMGATGTQLFAIVVFHVLVAFMCVAWCHTTFTDPGMATEEWQCNAAAAAAAAAADPEAPAAPPLCRRSGLHKPPRSHYDSVTGRLTLNMDHFCPWVVNTVGYYNRKFFLLFLLYANLTALCGAVSLGVGAPTMWAWLHSAASAGRLFPQMVNVCLFVGAICLDVVLLCALLPFLQYHVTMARRNETTIEGARFPQFNLGTERNLRSVMGRRRAVWLCPCYCCGPDGDGQHWPTADDPLAPAAGGGVRVTVANSLPACTPSAAAVAASRAPGAPESHQNPSRDVDAVIDGEAAASEAV